jgi:hypothetical protein
MPGRNVSRVPTLKVAGTLRRAVALGRWTVRPVDRVASILGFSSQRELDPFLRRGDGTTERACYFDNRWLTCLNTTHARIAGS